MLNEFYYNGKRIIDIIKRGGRGNRYILLEDNSEILFPCKAKIKIQTRCSKCGELSNPTDFYFNKDKNLYICFKCRGHTSFLGKHHSEKTKQIISKKAKERDYSGERNPMYGKNIKDYMSEEAYEKWRKNISNSVSGERNPMYGKNIKDYMSEEAYEKWLNKQRENSKNLTNEQRKKIGERFKQANDEWKKRDPDGYKKAKQEAAHISRLKQGNYKKSNIEIKVEEWLKLHNINYEYSCIMGFNDGCYQYDFIIHKKRILIEVQGDYWHGNPKLFNIDGSEGKRKLNETQLFKIEADKLKYNYAIEHNFKLLYIWENDVNNGNFDSLKEILND